MTSGSLCAVGDVLAQSIAGWYASRGGGGQEEDDPQTSAADKKKKKGAAPRAASTPAPPYDACRTLRMAGFGLLFYGPYQYYWYSLLEHLMPARTVPNFAAKVAANQLFLAPVTLTAAFAWHLAFSSAAASSAYSSSACASSASGKGGKGSKKAASPSASSPSSSPPSASLRLPGRLAPLPEKLRADFVPALLTGWKFWVPAASVNFCAVPLRQQVLYMSCCGVLWTAYLSHASGNGVGGKAAAAPAAAAGTRR